MTKVQDAPAGAAAQGAATDKGSKLGGNGSAGPIASAPAVGGPATPAGTGLSLPRGELILAGKSVVRSMRRVTHGPGPRAKSDGEGSQLAGDAARIGALASILDPNAGLAALGADADGAALREPRDILERLRLHFGELGYMQGMLDENVCRHDGHLDGLTGWAKSAPDPEESAADLWVASDDEIQSARAVWSARGDLDFDALLLAQEVLSDLDDRRRNLDHQVDALSDLLARLDDAGTAPVPRHIGDTILYGIGWHLAGDSQRMAAALLESREAAAASPKPSIGAAATVQPTPAPAAPRPPRGTPFAAWAEANKIEGGRMAILQALAGLQRWSGFYDALTGALLREVSELRTRTDVTSATRRALSAEIQRRALQARVENRDAEPAAPSAELG